MQCHDQRKFQAVLLCATEDCLASMNKLSLLYNPSVLTNMQPFLFVPIA